MSTWPDTETPMRPDTAIAIRPGEHACCRLAQAEDRRRLALAFVRAGLNRGDRVIYLGAEDDERLFVADLVAADPRAQGAITRGQVEVRSAPAAYIPDGSFDPARMQAALRNERTRTVAGGYPGLSMAGDMSWALDVPAGLDELAAYEREVTSIMDARIAFLCIYDHGRFPAGKLSDLVECHEVDVSPDLAALGRLGYLAASRVVRTPAVRICGELDYVAAEALAGVLDAHYNGSLTLDLADVTFADVAGLRALPGERGRRLTIVSASQPVRKLFGLLGWDTDPEIEIAEEKE
jgi:anti-anti-sigma regulatory factor